MENNFLDNFILFFKSNHKYAWYECGIIILGIVIFLLLIFINGLEKIKKGEYWLRIKDKVNIVFCVIGGILMLSSFFIIATKDIYDYRIEFYPYSVGPVDISLDSLNDQESIYYVNFIFRNKSDLPTSIENIYFYLTVDRECIDSSMIKERELEYLVSEKHTTILYEPFGLPSGKSILFKIPFRLSYLEKNNVCEIITSCNSEKNLNMVSLKTIIKIDSKEFDSVKKSISFDYLKIIYTIDSPSIVKNVEYSTNSIEIVNEDSFKGKNLPNKRVEYFQTNSKNNIKPKIDNINPKIRRSLIDEEYNDEEEYNSENIIDTEKSSENKVKRRELIK